MATPLQLVQAPLVTLPEAMLLQVTEVTWFEDKVRSSSRHAQKPWATPCRGAVPVEEILRKQALATRF
jgi:hypothetical protein